MTLTEAERRVVAQAPRPDWFVGQKADGCTVGHCATVRAACGTCMCALVRKLQDQKAGPGALGRANQWSQR